MCCCCCSVTQSCLFVIPWTAAHQASLSSTISQSLLKLISFESVMPSNHLILCRPLLLLPLIFPSIRVFSNESVLGIRWPKDWSFSFSLNPYNEYSRVVIKKKKKIPGWPVKLILSPHQFHLQSPDYDLGPLPWGGSRGSSKHSRLLERQVTLVTGLLEIT